MTTRTESPARRHARRLADMTGTTRDIPDAAPSMLTRSRRRAMQSGSDDERPTGTGAPASHYLQSLSSRGTTASIAQAPAAIEPRTALSTASRKVGDSTGRISPTKDANPFTGNTALKKMQAARANSPTRPSQMASARLAASRIGDSRSTLFQSPTKAAEMRVTDFTTKSDLVQESRSPSSTRTTADGDHGVGLSRRRSLRTRNPSDENENPFGPPHPADLVASVRADTAQALERAERLSRRRSLRTAETMSDVTTSRTETVKSTITATGKGEQRSYLGLPKPDRDATATTSSVPDADTIARLEKERQERLARRRSLYEYQPPRRAVPDADAQEVDRLLGTHSSLAKPTSKTADNAQSSSTLARTSNPFTRPRPKSSVGPPTADLDGNINEVKSSFQRLTIDSNRASNTNKYTPIRSSRPPVTTPGLQQRVPRPQSTSLAAAIATDARKAREPLRGCTILVDIRDQDGDDMSGPWIDKLKAAGAKVYARWPANSAALTHVVWKAGRPTTLAQLRALEKEAERQAELNERAAEAAIAASEPGSIRRSRSTKSLGDEADGRSRPAAEEDQPEQVKLPLIVGVLWAHACVTEGRRVEEEPYLVEIGKEAIFNRRRRSSMAPKSLPTAPSSSPVPSSPVTHSRGRKSLASSSLRADIEKARRQSLQYAPVVSSPLRKRAFNDPEAFSSSSAFSILAHSSERYSSTVSTTSPATTAVNAGSKSGAGVSPLRRKSRAAETYQDLATLRWATRAVDEVQLHPRQDEDASEDGVVAMDLDDD